MELIYYLNLVVKRVFIPSIFPSARTIKIKKFEKLKKKEKEIDQHAFNLKPTI